MAEQKGQNNKKVDILIIGSPKAECKNCRNAEKFLDEYLKGKNQAKFTYTKMFSNDEKAKKFGVISTPTIIVNNAVLHMGKGISGEEIDKMFASYDLK